MPDKKQVTRKLSFVVAVFMGMVTATGGGVIRDIMTQTRPMILCGEVYRIPYSAFRTPHSKMSDGSPKSVSG